MRKKTCPKCFSSISEGTRVKIIRYLKQGPSNAGDIGSHFALTQPTISYHLKFLEKIGLVFCQKCGRQIFYFLNKKFPCKKCFILKMPLKL